MCGKCLQVPSKLLVTSLLTTLRKDRMSPDLRLLFSVCFWCSREAAREGLCCVWLFVCLLDLSLCTLSWLRPPFACVIVFITESLMISPPPIVPSPPSLATVHLYLYWWKFLVPLSRACSGGHTHLPSVVFHWVSKTLGESHEPPLQHYWLSLTGGNKNP